MAKHRFEWKAVYRAAQGLLMLLLVLSTMGTPGLAAPKSRLYRYANNITIEAGTPIPIYKISSPIVTKDATRSLSQLFEGIFDDVNLTVEEDSYLEHSRFTGLNEKNHTILEQFGATGGFYAYEPTRAFSGASIVAEPMLDTGLAQSWACQFILLHFNTLHPSSDDLTYPGLEGQCSNDFKANPLYRVSVETLSGQENTPGADTTNTAMRLLVTMPIEVNTGFFSQVPMIPLGGPGGHISMIFDNTNVDSLDPSLDENIVGLQAVAMPGFGRSLSFSRNVPAADPVLAKEQVAARVRASYPDGSDIVVPDPSLVYFMTDAATPQELMEPMLVFAGVTVEVDGGTQVLRDIVLPGVESGPDGLGPTVTILSPLDGAVHFPGVAMSLEGEVSDGIPPYDYEWQLDDGTSLGTGTLNEAGALPPLVVDIPTSDDRGVPGGESVRLAVTDSEGVTRQQVVSLISATDMFLPLLGRSASNTSASLFGNNLTLAPENPDIVNYSFGIEYGSDYPPPGVGGSDLGAVPPDANGFSSGLSGLGWPRVFKWVDSLAWEKDWRDCSLGGIDCTYGVDRADFVYYAGHGSAGGISLPSNRDSSWFDGINARYQNIRWVGFASCQTLRAQWPVAGSEPIRRWFNAFQGAHMLLGFNSNMADVPYGPRFVDNMRIPTFLFFEFPWAQRTIAEAWVQTAFELNAGKPAYIYATSASVNPAGNKLPKVGDPLLPRPTPVNWFYWVWWNE